MADDLQAAGVQAQPQDDPGSLLKALSMGGLQQPIGQGSPLAQAQADPNMRNWAGLAGFGAGVQGQGTNPVVAQVMQQQEQDMRSRLATVSVMQSVQKMRREKQKDLQEIYAAAAKSDVPEAMTWGFQGLFSQAKQLGGDVPEPLKAGLMSRKIKPGEIEEVGKLLVRGVSPNLIQQTYPWATPEVTQGMQSKGLSTLAASLGLKTPEQLQAEELKNQRESVKLLREESYPELKGPVEQFVLLAHADMNDGKTYFEGDNQSRKEARTAGYKAWQAAEAAKRPSHSGERIVTPSGGQYWNRAQRRYEAAVPAAELEAQRDNFILVPQRQIELQEYATRSLPTLVEIKRLIPRVLATQPVENIRRALELQGANIIKSSEDLRRLNTLVFDANLEQVRALGGSSVVRQRLLDLLSKHAGIATTDTQKTALGVIDISVVNMENLRRAPVRDPMIRLDQRIGPGKYIVQDRVTGQKKGMTLEEGQVSPPSVIVLESY